MERYLRAKHWLLLFFLSLLIVTMTGCRRGGNDDLPDINIDIQVLPNPPQVGSATISLTFTDPEGQPVTGAEVELEGNMSHAGMAPVFTQATEVAPGQYEAPLEFTMGGDWFILVKATLPDGRTLERSLNLPGVTSGQ
jgi:hypothetical protein